LKVSKIVRLAARISIVDVVDIKATPARPSTAPSSCWLWPAQRNRCLAARFGLGQDGGRCRQAHRDKSRLVVRGRESDTLNGIKDERSTRRSCRSPSRWASWLKALDEIITIRHATRQITASTLRAYPAFIDTARRS